MVVVILFVLFEFFLSAFNDGILAQRKEGNKVRSDSGSVSLFDILNKLTDMQK